MTAWSFPTLNTLSFPGDGAGPDLMARWPLTAVLDGACAAGFKLVGIDHVSVAAFLDDGGSLGELRGLLAERGLGCSDVGVLRIGADAEPAVQLARHLAELGNATGARLCATTFDTEVNAASVAVLAACAGSLHEAGIRVALEFVPYTPLRTIAAARAVCREVGWDRCGVLVDSWMFFRGEDAWSDFGALAAGEVAAVQVNDAPPMMTDLVTESRHRRVPPGEGVFDLARFLFELRALPYQGPVSVEVLSSELRQLPPLAQAEIAMRSLRHLEEDIS